MIEDQLISKKDLLDLTGISYGQLYRWKRKDLIPEEWFVRKSTYTGQETFFPKDKILERIDKIVNMKDNLSLDELADMFSPNLASMALTKAELVERNIITAVAMQLFTEQAGDAEAYSFEQIIYVYALDQMLQTGQMSIEEGKRLLQVLREQYKKLQGKGSELVMLRNMGSTSFLLVSSPNEIYVDHSTKLIVRLSMTECVEQLKVKLT